MKLNFKYISLVAGLFGLLPGLRAQTYVFAQLQGSPVMNTTGWNLSGAAAIGDTPGDADGFSNELILTQPIGNSSGGIFWGQPLNLTQCQKWSAEFEFRMFDGNGADGIAFCFLDVPPAGFVTGGGVGIPATANGLKIVFDTFENFTGTQANPEIQIRYGVGYHQFNPPFNTQPTLPNTGGSLNFLRSTNYQSAKVTYDNGNIRVYVENTLYLTGFYQINFTGYLGFTSSTGGSNDRHSIRNVTIYTEQAQSEAGPPAISYCSGGGVQIGTTNNPAFVYSWSPSNGLDQNNISNPTVSLVNNTNVPVTQTYTVTTTLAASPGICPTTDAIAVTVNPSPTSTFSASALSTCENQALTFTYTGNMTGTAGYTWNFDGGTVLSGSGQGPYQVSWPAAGTHAVTLTVSAYGCVSAVETKNITVNVIPTATFTHPVRLCTGEPGAVTYTGTAGPAATYNWNFDGGTVVSGTQQGPYSVSWPVAGLKNAALTVTENGCVSPAYTDTVRVHPYPVPGLSLPPAMCGQDTILIQYSGTALPADQNAWAMFHHWSGGTYILSPPSPARQYYWTTSVPGTYTFTNQVTINGCASDSIFETLTVYPVPTATFTATPEACTGADVTLTYTGTAGPAATYDWTTAPGTVQSGSGQGPLTLTYANAGNATVRLRVTENNCVSGQVSVPVTIHAVPSSDFNLAPGICEGQTATLTYAGTGTPGASYDWAFGGVEVRSGTGMGPYVLGDAQLGTFTVTLQVTENNCTGAPTSKEFIVLPTPTADFAGTPLTGCNPLPVKFTNLTTVQPGMQYQWSFGNGAVSTQADPLYVYTAAGTYTVTLAAANGFGCADTATKTAYVKVTAQPVAGFTLSPPKVTMDNPGTHVIDNSLYAETWLYTMDDGTTYDLSSPFHTYKIPGEYVVTQVVTNSLGCSDTAVRTIEVLPSTNVFIPNAFSPNGDGTNDEWNAVISYITSFELRIFDRWGGAVFETDDVYEGWNGRFRNNGKPMKDEVYVYIIRFRELSGKTREITGHITLLR